MRRGPRPYKRRPGGGSRRSLCRRGHGGKAAACAAGATPAGTWARASQPPARQCECLSLSPPAAVVSEPRAPRWPLRPVLASAEPGRFPASPQARRSAADAPQSPARPPWPGSAAGDRQPPPCPPRVQRFRRFEPHSALPGDPRRAFSQGGGGPKTPTLHRGAARGQARHAPRVAPHARCSPRAPSMHAGHFGCRPHTLVTLGAVHARWSPWVPSPHAGHRGRRPCTLVTAGAVPRLYGDRGLAQHRALRPALSPLPSLPKAGCPRALAADVGPSPAHGQNQGPSGPRPRGPGELPRARGAAGRGRVTAPGGSTLRTAGVTGQVTAPRSPRAFRTLDWETPNVPSTPLATPSALSCPSVCRMCRNPSGIVAP